MTTDEGRELLCNIQGPIAARLIAISQARFAAGGSTNIISIFRRSSRPICRSPDSLLIRLLRLLADVRPRVRDKPVAIRHSHLGQALGIHDVGVANDAVDI